MKWPLTCASTITAYQYAKVLTIGPGNINVILARRHQPAGENMGKDVCSSARTKPASAKKRNANAAPLRDFRIVDSNSTTYRCRMAWQRWLTQADCHFSVKNPDYDRCWHQTLKGECIRED